MTFQAKKIDTIKLLEEIILLEMKSFHNSTRKMDGWYVISISEDNYDQRGLPIFDDVAVFTTKIDMTQGYDGQMKQASLDFAGTMFDSKTGQVMPGGVTQINFAKENTYTAPEKFIIDFDSIKEIKWWKRLKKLWLFINLKMTLM